MKTNEKLQAEIMQINENYNMGFITPLEAIMQTYNALMHSAEEIEEGEKRDEYYTEIFKSFENDHMTDAWCEISTKWINA